MFESVCVVKLQTLRFHVGVPTKSFCKTGFVFCAYAILTFCNVRFIVKLILNLVALKTKVSVFSRAVEGLILETKYFEFEWSVLRSFNFLTVITEKSEYEVALMKCVVIYFTSVISIVMLF